jgi:hypothetical protein
MYPVALESTFFVVFLFDRLVWSLSLLGVENKLGGASLMDWGSMANSEGETSFSRKEGVNPLATS